MRGPEDRVHGREERARDQPVARHGEQDTGLAQQEHEENARDPDHRTERDEEHGDRKPANRERPRNRGVEVDLVVRDHAGQHGRHQDVEDRAEPERGDDRDRYVALRIAGLLGVGRDRVEADVGEEDVGGALEDAGDTVREEGMPVLRLDVAGAEADHEEDDHQPATTVTRSTTAAAGRLQIAPVWTQACVPGSKSIGVPVQRPGRVTPKRPRNEMK